MTSLKQKFTDLGLKKASEIIPSSLKQKRLISDLPGAIITETDHGNLVSFHNFYPYGYKHGVIEFSPQISTGEINKTTLKQSSELHCKNLAFLDTETTGLSGGTGTIAFLVGIGIFSASGFELVQYVLDDPFDEPALLLNLDEFFKSIEGFVTFNGKAFDIPLLKTRYILNKIPHQLDKKNHIDLLHLSRRIWKLRLPARSLKDLEREILKLPRSSDEIPGWMIPEIYFEYLRNGDASKITNVIYHNSMDIVSLAALFISISNMLEQELSDEYYDVIDLFSIGKIFEDIGDREKSIHIYEFCKNSQKLSKDISLDLNNRLSVLYKQNGSIEKAVDIWRNNVEQDDYFSCIELAKYYEHNLVDITEALKWTISADKINNSSDISRYMKNKRKQELLIRKSRLEKRKV